MVLENGGPSDACKHASIQRRNVSLAGPECSSVADIKSVNSMHLQHTAQQNKTASLTPTQRKTKENIKNE